MISKITIKILSIEIDRSMQSVQTQSAQGLLSLPFCLHFWKHYCVVTQTVPILGELRYLFWVSLF